VGFIDKMSNKNSKLYDSNIYNIGMKAHFLAPPAIEARLEKAVLGLFPDKDYHQVNMRDISKEAKVSVATIYKYYESKEELIFYLANKWLEWIKERTIDHLKGLEDIKEKIRKIIWVNLEFYERNTDIGKILMITVPLKSWLSSKTFKQKELFDLFLEVIRQGQREGILSNKARPGDLIDVIHGSVIRTFIMWVYRGQRESLTGKANMLFEIVWQGISKPNEK